MPSSRGEEWRQKKNKTGGGNAACFYFEEMTGTGKSQKHVFPAIQTILREIETRVCVCVTFLFECEKGGSFLRTSPRFFARFLTRDVECRRGQSSVVP